MPAIRPALLRPGLFALLLALACLPIQPVLAGDWSVGNAPGGDASAKAATTTNSDGEALYIWAKHLEDRSLIFAELHLSEGDEFAGRMPIYRIDDGPIIDTEMVRREGEKQGSLWGFVAGRASFWLLWSSNQPTVDPSDHLAKWMDGKALRITYQDSDGSQKIAAFDLEGARKAIETATGVSEQ